MPWSLSELDPLIFLDGEAVRTSADWTRRRAELRRLFEDAMYGPWPGRTDHQRTDVTLLFHDASAFDETAAVAELEVRVADPACRFRLLVVTPNTPGPHPCFLGANFHGNHTVLDHPGVSVSDRWTVAGPEPARGQAADRWDVRASVAAGYAVATFFCGDLVQDRPDLAADDLAGFVGAGGRPGALMVWAWGLAVARTVLAARSDLDADAIVAVGHSRLGKAALLAGGWGGGFGAVVAAQSGTAGAAPSRKAPEQRRTDARGRPRAETVDAVTATFPHWFAPALLDYADRVEELPVDQHQLLALCAPVPTLVWSGTADSWADPGGTALTVAAAAPTFALLGAHQPPPTAPALGVSAGTLAHGLRPGGHTVTSGDWASWRDWCDLRLPRRRP